MQNNQGEVRDVIRGTKKRRVMTSQLVGKFSSKKDFIKYFEESLQLYLPPEKMMNKDFLKQVLAEKKKLLPLSEVKHVNVPHYEELSVKKFFPILSVDENFASYMPDPTAEGRLPDRVYFWNVANTVQHDYVAKVIKHATEKRMSAQGEQNQAEIIEISDKWWDRLNALPFISQQKGHTLNLLKQASKPVPVNRKRVKHDIYDANIPAFSVNSKEEVKQEEPASSGAHASAATGRRTPNIISNIEAPLGGTSAFKSTSSLLDPNQQSQYPYGQSKPEQQKPDEAMFSHIAPKRTTDQEYRMSMRKDMPGMPMKK